MPNVNENLIMENEFISRTVKVASCGKLLLDTFLNKETRFNWALGGSSCDIKINSTDEKLNAELKEKWTVVNTRLKSIDGGLKELAVDFSHPSGLYVTQYTVIFPETATIQQKCKIENRGNKTVSQITSFSPLCFNIQKFDDLLIHTIKRDVYSMNSYPLVEEVAIKGGNWNQPENAGWLMIENKKEKEFLYIGLEWEREWMISISPDADGFNISCGLMRYSRDLMPGDSIESPIVFIGLSSGDMDDAANAMHKYLSMYVFPPMHKNFPWTTYNIWSTDSERVEELLLKELDFASDLGLEVFYIDASWWAGSSVLGQGAWGLGLGNYQEDYRKFPHGLKYFSDCVHKKGMKFGLWVDPMIFDEQWLINGTIPDKWLVKNNDVPSMLEIKMNDWPKVLQLCPGCPEAREYLFSKLSNIIERYSLDWMKWDDSALAAPVCTRSDHGHQSGEGNFEAVKGKYEICARLMEKFPHLVIEQCGYPARLDYGLARYIRSNWLSDATSPSEHVRMNMEIASYVYPASYNTAHLLQDKEILEETDPASLDTIVRSRMLGLFGMNTLNGKLSERASLWPSPIIEAIKRNLPDYKKFRHVLSQKVYHLLPYSKGSVVWNVVEYASYDENEVVILAFRNRAENETCMIIPRGISSEKEYKVFSLNTGAEKNISGKQLMEEGIAVNLECQDTSEIILLKSM